MNCSKNGSIHTKSLYFYNPNMTDINFTNQINHYSRVPVQ